MGEIIKMQDGLRAISIIDVARPEVIGKSLNATGLYQYGSLEIVTLGDTKNEALTRLFEMPVVGKEVYIYKNIYGMKRGFADIEIEIVMKALIEQYLYGKNRVETRDKFNNYFLDVKEK